MFSLIDQLRAAGTQAAHMASAAKAAAEQKAAWQATARQRQWESRRNKSKPSLLDTIHKLLPAAPDAGMTCNEIAAALTSHNGAYTGITSALSRLLKQGRIARIDQCRPYRYFNPNKDTA